MVATIECIERSRARESWAISAPSPTIGRSVSVPSRASASSSSSSTPTTCGPVQRSTRRRTTLVRLGGGGLVEDGGGGGPPVDQQRVAVVRRAGRSGRCSGARGRPPRAGRGGRRPAPRGRRRAARSAWRPGRPSRRARRAHPRGPAVPGRGPRGRAPGPPADDCLELEVDPVHELLLASDLTLGQLFGQRSFPSVPDDSGKSSSLPRHGVRRLGAVDERVVEHRDSIPDRSLLPVQERGHRLAGLVGGEQPRRQRRHLVAVRRRSGRPGRG